MSIGLVGCRDLVDGRHSHTSAARQDLASHSRTFEASALEYDGASVAVGALADVSERFHVTF